MEEKDVPRYQAERLYEFDDVGENGHILSYHGGKLIDGVIHYPVGAVVDMEQAARVQAVIDYSYRPGNVPTPNEELEKLYGETYTKRFEQMKSQKIRRAFDGVLHHVSKLFLSEK